MTEKLIGKSCEAFTEQLASTAPVPGGGGAAALMGALSAALCAMAANLTRGRKKYADAYEMLTAAAERAEALRSAQLAQIDADAAAFEPLSRAYSMPKDDPAYAETMRRVSLDACAAPLEMLRLCSQTVELLEQLLHDASPLLISDVGCGAAACRAAADCAAMNVWVNTKGLKGDEQAEALDRETEALRADCVARAEAVARAVTERLISG